MYICEHGDQCPLACNLTNVYKQSGSSDSYLHFCHNCGSEVLPGRKFCPNCGAPQDGNSNLAPSGRVETRRYNRRQTTELSLTVSCFGFGLVLASLGSLYLFALPISSVSIGVGLLILVAGVVSLSSGYGLLRARRWARRSGVAVAIGDTAAGFLLAVSLNAGLTILGLVAIGFGLWNLVYLRQARSKAYLVG